MKSMTWTIIFAATCGIAIAQAPTDGYGVVLISQQSALVGIGDGDSRGFPITITHSGHYRLVTDLTVPPGSDGIDISADYVTLDLNGFRIVGSANLSFGVNSVLADHTSVINGSVLGMGDGVYVASFGRVEGITTSNNVNGIIAGPGSLVKSNISANNGNAGIQVSCPSAILGNVASSNATDEDLVVGNGCTRAGNVPGP